MKNTKTIVVYGLLTAIIILMAFTPLGYLKTPGLEITFITIPVIVGAVILGPAAGAVLGGIFGLTSFAQAFGMSAFGVELMSINPIFTFIVCMVPRILMGWCCGLIFKAFKNKERMLPYFTVFKDKERTQPHSYAFKNKDRILPYFIASVSGALLNTLFFMTALLALFGNCEYIKNMQGGNNIIVFAALFVGINGVVEAIVAAIAGTAISRAVSKLKK